MQVIPITRNELALDTDDWRRLTVLLEDFDKVCDSQSCASCPLGDFCLENPNPAEYLKNLYEFLDDYPKERK